MKQDEKDLLIDHLRSRQKRAKSLGFGDLLERAASVIEQEVRPEPEHMTIYLCSRHGGYGFASDCRECKKVA